jgi:MFS transporter, ACS family, tartrate transporter
MHVIAYADRVNITFAETEITSDLALSSTVFGLAAGIFFLSYVVLEVPSNSCCTAWARASGWAAS